jgi:murein DD-endopeptidase MepM/ murein hydrolase activator NlpD
MSALFQQFYNSGKFDSIHALFSKETKEALPLDKTKEVLEQVTGQAGRILKREFLKYEGTYACYKTDFENVTLNLQVSVDKNNKIDGLFIKPYVEETIPKIERNQTALSLPFKGEWTVFWGGDTKELNYHVTNQAQKGAFDIIISDAGGKSYKTNGQKNEDYYAFGKELYAACDGEVVLVVDGIKDNTPGVLNPIYLPGNTVIIKTKNNEYLFFAHFKQHSIIVKEGQLVKRGQPLGLCGNSGNSSEPHLHFHIQNTEDMNLATGTKCYFDKLIVNGQLKTDYSPIKGDKIKSE